jgi:D-beta-D-heptose 7-phosphate kinase/D-beta-D-heptose 1-phosphate adenosyltransferase
MNNILIIGDIILDHYVIGDVNRISPEAPVPVLEFKEEFYRLGGAANVANNIEVTRNVTLRGVGGFGSFSIWEKLIKGKSFHSKIDLNNPGFLVKTRYAANHHYLLRLDKGTQYESTFMNPEGLVEDIEAADVIVVSDYNKGTITDEIACIINRYKAGKKKIIVDSKNYTNKRIFYGSYLITPNTEELKKLLNTYVITDDLISRFMHFYNIKYLLHTKGHEGMTLYWDNGTGLHSENYPVVDEKQVVDVTGAGDTVVATIAETLSQGLSLNTAIKMANLKASIVVQKFGTATIEG